MLIEDLTCQMLREHIRRVVFACNLEQLKISGTDPVLYPQLARGQVAHLADAGALTDSHRN